MEEKGPVVLSGFEMKSSYIPNSRDLNILAHIPEL